MVGEGTLWWLPVVVLSALLECSQQTSCFLLQGDTTS